MTKEQMFERVLRNRIDMAREATGHSFFYLLEGIENEGAVKLARRYIASKNVDHFQDGLKILKRFGLLRLSVEQTIIDFNSRGYIFSDEEAQAARDRLQIVELLVR